MNITDNFRDAAYIAIGMGVLGVQRAQVRREELAKLVSAAVKDADARVEPVIKAVEAQIDSAVDRLPEPAKPIVARARKASEEARKQVRNALAPLVSAS